MLYLSAGYQAILQRLCSTSTLTTVKEKERRDAEKSGDLGPEFDLGFISHAQFDISINNDVVRFVVIYLSHCLLVFFRY